MDDCRREALPGRDPALDEARRGPAFWRVFCRVRSFSERSVSPSGWPMGCGDATGTEVEVTLVVVEWSAGEGWKEWFLRIPGMLDCVQSRDDGRERALWTVAVYAGRGDRRVHRHHG